MPERDRYLDAAPIFLEAVELPREKRDAWIRRACGDDEELLREVLSLLEFDNQAAVGRKRETD
jgi:hypothetical protein